MSAWSVMKDTMNFQKLVTTVTVYVTRAKVICAPNILGQEGMQVTMGQLGIVLKFVEKQITKSNVFC